MGTGERGSEASCEGGRDGSTRDDAKSGYVTRLGDVSATRGLRKSWCRRAVLTVRPDWVTGKAVAETRLPQSGSKQQGGDLDVWKRAVCGAQRLDHGGGDKVGNVATEFGHLFNEAGAGVAECLARHDEEGFDVGLEVAIHQRHIKLELKIGEGTQAANDGGGFFGAGKLNQQAIEEGSAYVGKMAGAGDDEREASLRGEKRAFTRITGDCHGDAVEQLRSTLKHIEMPVSKRIERAGVNAVAHEMMELVSVGE